jgi:hypothetical protein
VLTGQLGVGDPAELTLQLPLQTRWSIVDPRGAYWTMGWRAEKLARSPSVKGRLCGYDQNCSEQAETS